MSTFRRQFPNILRFIWILNAEFLLPWQCKLQISLQKCHRISTRPHGITYHKTVIFNSHANYICATLNQSYPSNNPITRISLRWKSNYSDPFYKADTSHTGWQRRKGFLLKWSHIPLLTWQFQPVFIYKCCSNNGNSNIEKQQLKTSTKAATSAKGTSLPTLNCLKFFVH